MNTKKLKQEFRQMVKEFDGEKAHDNIAGSMCEHYAIEFAKRVLNPRSISVVEIALCGSFDPDTTTSIATKCKCGREKWEHPKTI